MFEQLANSAAMHNESAVCKDYSEVMLLNPINLNGLKVSGIHCANNSISSIDTDLGTFDSGSAPSAWTYLLIALYPILGFFIPWGANRVLEWVCAGFVEHGK